MTQGDEQGIDRRGRRRAAADGRLAGFKRKVEFSWTELFDQSFRTLFDLLCRKRKHLQHRHFLEGFVSLKSRECRFECREAQLVAPQRAIERMFAQALDDFTPAYDQSGLRGAE